MAGRTDRAGTSAAARVRSPCIGVCRIDSGSGLCEGCLRTLDEIARWGTMDDDARGAVRQAIDARRKTSGAPAHEAQRTAARPGDPSS